jgi:formylglycine-generating enzyme required for sulfatase activity
VAVIPAGTFLIGLPASEEGGDSDEGPQQEVSIQSFAFGRTEVTFDEYDRFARATGRELPDDEGWGRGNRPVINVSWYDAVAYAEWLSDQTGKACRLLTETEWEYTARAGTTPPFSTGDCITIDQANYAGNYDYTTCGAKTGVFLGETIPAVSPPPNHWELHEVHNNVWEWMQDCWHDNYEGSPSSCAVWEEGGDSNLHMIRGGSLGFKPVEIRSAYREGFTADDAEDSIGFLLARTLD